MLETLGELSTLTESASYSSFSSSSSSSHILSSYSSAILMQCEQLLSLVLNKTAVLNDQQLLPNYIRQLLSKQNLTIRLPKTVSECAAELTRLANSTSELNATLANRQQKYGLQDRSRSLIIFVILIGLVSVISIIGNLCLAKVLYSKRSHLIQTDRIVLCLALSELCLVLIDTPTEIYRFLSYSFAQEWLCRFHTFFEALFSSCIIFYHLLGAFDRFVYIHGHTSTNPSTWSVWCRRISTKPGSIILLILPILCSLPIAICNCLHADMLYASMTNKICIVQYTDGILIGLLISFYILPLLFSFFLHAKLIYFIRTRHNQHYLTKTSYMLPMKRNNTLDSQSLTNKKRQQDINTLNQFLLQPNTSRRHLFMIKRDQNPNTIGSTTTTVATVQSAPLNINTTNSINSSGSSRSSTATSSASITSSIVLYKINSQANANANRTVVLLVLLLSFYVFCWAPYNIYTWYHAYQLTHSTKLNNRMNNLTSSSDFNQTFSINNLTADLRRIILINYSLYLLSMISMCFSFIFYFSLNKHARHEFSRFTGCICPWINHMRNGKQRKKFPKQEQERSRHFQYDTRYQQRYSNRNERIKLSSPPLNNNRCNYMTRRSYPQYATPKRIVLDYGCRIQCCP